MGGKSYLCDFCCCFLKNDLNVRKIHNAGLPHKIAKAYYMKLYQNPRDTLREETGKTPCLRYFKGLCKFGLYCQFSHYTSLQLKELKEIVQNLESGVYQKTKEAKKQRAISKRKRKLNILPPSLRASIVENANICLTGWGQ